MFHLLLYVTEIIKQSHAVRGGRFRIEFQPGQGNLDHTHGDRLRSRPRYFSPFFPVRGSGTPSPTTESDHSAPVRRDIKINPTSTRRVRDRSTRRSNQVLKLTDYHISRYVASTFKRLTRWATHRDLSHFWLHQGYHNYTTPPVVLTFQQELKSVQFLFARERQETTQLLPYLFSMATSRYKDPVSNIGSYGSCI